MHSAAIRDYNASRIFHMLRLMPGISQQEVCDRTGIDKSTVSAVLADFDRAGLLARARRSQQGRGRPVEALSIATDGGLLVGLTLKPEHIEYSISGLDGTALHTSGNLSAFSAHDIAERVTDAITSMCAAIDRSLEEIRAIGVAVPGFVTVDGVIALSPNLDWHDVPLQALLREATGCPVYVDNDANAAALAERLFGIGAEAENFVYIESGSGFGAGVMIDGEIYRGGSGFGGEIGHMKIVPHGHDCHCGMKGCLSAYVSDYALLRQANAAGLTATNIAGLAASAKQGDEVAIAIFREASDYLGIGLANVATILSPSLVVLGGTIARHADLFLDAALESFTQHVVPAVRESCRIELAARDSDPASLGAVAIALQGCTSAAAADAAPWRSASPPKPTPTAS